MVLYLDFDGVLHPGANVLRNLQTGEPELQSPDNSEQLFMYAPLLVELLRPYPEVRIVLSTSWVRAFGFACALGYLPHALQARVIGSTTQEHERARHPIPCKGRFEEIYEDTQRRKLGDLEWIALDDDAYRWNLKYAANLVRCDIHFALSEFAVQERLLDSLNRGATCRTG